MIKIGTVKVSEDSNSNQCSNKVYFIMDTFHQGT